MGKPGFGNPGYCRLCAADPPEAAAELIRAAQKGFNNTQALAIGTKYGLKWSRDTWYSHRKHCQTPEGRVIQAAEIARQAEPGLKLTKTSNTGLLEAIRDLGMARALRDPDAVTVDHALKAVQIMETRKDKKSDSLAILVQFVTGAPPPIQIEGTSRDVSN